MAKRGIPLSRGDRIFDFVNIALLTVILIIVLYPLYFVLIASVSDPVLVLQGKVWFMPETFSFEPYMRVFQNADIVTGYRNVILYTVVGTLVNLILTVAGAYPLSRKDFAGRNAIMLLITFTMFFSGGIIPTYMVVRDLGLVNSFWALILPGAVSVWNLIIMRTFFQNTIPTELQESAFMDGCSNFRLLISIILPLSMPVVAVVTLYYAVGHWNSYFQALIYLSDRSRYPLQMFLRELLIQNQMQNMMETDSESMAKQALMAEGLKYAVIVVSSLPVLCLYPFLQRYFAKGVMIGAVKG
ncbi:carbohydrate ABC transporter permease [Paenibacillus contaminans]|uniref:Carbohydrate ABC transporter permease n=1 Tax=Paenibacillus contaminans TaxID=450362 RepID=A0A329MSJ2_9BACL|nr:carbohydrate ABC transporter permease [Paenibacillus contaminans]RAV22326.1 carbohydrate ABC transporter permease [Paenibacillus contaminans]